MCNSVVYCSYVESPSPIDALIRALSSAFPIDLAGASRFGFFPFSNDTNAYSIFLELSRQAPTPYPPNNIRVALLFGESHWISLVGALDHHFDVLILADIEPKLHQHNEFLYECLMQSHSPREFIEYYQGKPHHAIKPIETPEKCKNTLCVHQDPHSLHFLSERNFLIYKEKVRQLKRIKINFDAFSVEQAMKLRGILDEHHAGITLANFTNIAQYDALKSDHHAHVIHALFHDSFLPENTYIISSHRKLISILYRGYITYNIDVEMYRGELKSPMMNQPKTNLSFL